MTNAPEPRQKPSPKPKPYHQTLKNPKTSEEKAVVSSAKPAESGSRRRLTVNDWVAVFQFCDEHPGMAQWAVASHFSTLEDGAREFTQATLSRKLRDKDRILARINSHPSVLSIESPRAPNIEEPVDFPGKDEVGKGEKEIISKTQHQVERREVIEIEDSDEENEEKTEEVIQLCRRLERACISYGSDETVTVLSRCLRQFRGQLQAQLIKNTKQTSITEHFPCVVQSSVVEK